VLSYPALLSQASMIVYLWIDAFGGAATMKLTDRRLVARVGIGLTAVSVLAFGVGVNQGRQPPSEPAPLPIPAGLVSAINLQSVPNATAIAADANAVDPSLRSKPRKAKPDEGNTTEEGADDSAPPEPSPPPPPQPAPSMHGPY
jgi:hypothetical protein